MFCFVCEFCVASLFPRTPSSKLRYCQPLLLSQGQIIFQDFLTQTLKLPRRNLKRVQVSLWFDPAFSFRRSICFFLQNKPQNFFFFFSERTRPQSLEDESIYPLFKALGNSPSRVSVSDSCDSLGLSRSRTLIPSNSNETGSISIFTASKSDLVTSV